MTNDAADARLLALPREDRVKAIAGLKRMIASMQATIVKLEASLKPMLEIVEE